MSGVVNPPKRSSAKLGLVFRFRRDYLGGRRSGQAAPAPGHPGSLKGDVVSDILVKSIHAAIDAHGVRQRVAVGQVGRDLGREAAAALAASKRGNPDAYRVSMLALIAAMGRTPAWQVAPGTGLAARGQHVRAGGAAFMVDAAVMFPEPAEAFAAGHGWNDDSALSRVLKDNADKVGVNPARVLKYRDGKPGKPGQPGNHRFWILVTA